MREGCAVVDRSERGKLALTGPEAKEFLQGQVTNDIEGLEPGTGCYAAFLTHKGKMLGDLRVLDTGDELLLDCERVALQELFTMIRRYKLGRAVELHKRTLESGLLSLIGPGARGVAGAEDLPATEHAHRAGELGGRARAARRHRPRRRRAVRRRRHRAGRGRAGGGRRRARGRGHGRGPPRGERAAALRRRSRRRRDPAGGRAQRARGVVHQGLLRRAGDGRPAALPGQAEPPPARPAAQRPGRARGCAAAGRAGGGPARQRGRIPRARGRSRWRWCGARRRPATRSRSAPATSRAVVVPLPFATA